MSAPEDKSPDHDQNYDHDQDQEVREADTSAGDSSPPIEGAKRIERSGEADPIELEQEPDDIQGLDVCGNCGAPLRGTDTTVCLRCGYNMKTMRVERTDTRDTTDDAEDSDDESDERDEWLRPGLGSWQPPLIIAAVAAVALLVGFLSGAAGLYFGEPVEGFGSRIAWAVRAIGQVALLGACGLGAIWLLARIELAQLGNLRIVATRMMAIAAVASLVRFFNLGEVLDWIVELILGLGAALGLVMLAFRINWREGLTLLGMTAGMLIVAFALVQVASFIVGV